MENPEAQIDIEIKKISSFKTFCKTELLGAVIANFIGGLIFYWVDLFIFQGTDATTNFELLTHVRTIPLYLLRWQLSTPILAFVMSIYRKKNRKTGG